ncbi:MBL fold metallo-hydrolase [Aquipuribacter sp. MA13-6]|uniref:MBL fold metallo-hydrolase n=1 Tax=unclassified Aquipuribacter TaxID=2635084 RepID=UPI003EF05216
MLVRAIEATAFGTNCWVLATGPGQECVVVDPGIGVLGPLEDLLREERLRPAAVLLTHGHADHVWSVTPVCRSAGAGVAVHVHPDDRYRLRDPLAQLAPELRGMLAGMFGPAERWQEPDDVLDLSAAAVGEQGGTSAPPRFQVAGLDLGVHHTPGHTEGSVVFHLDAATTGAEPWLLSGDLLFAGSIGRSDLFGGDPAAMTTSLRDVLPRFSDDTLVLPGHGPSTTMARERATNPYLTRLPSDRSPTRGH